MSNLTHNPEEVIFLTRTHSMSRAGRYDWTADLNSHMGIIRLPLHQDQAHLLMDAAVERDQVAGCTRITGGRRVVSFKRPNRLLIAANPPDYDDPAALVALLWHNGRYLAWVAGEGAQLRVLGDHEAEVILRRARMEQGALPENQVIARQQPYLFKGRSQRYCNDLAATLLPDEVPVELEADLDAMAEFAAFFGRDLLEQRLVRAWQGGAL
jgi:hypothetical protein